ncbi:MAG: enoyl-CoA hydratase/isomerase family protein [Pseudomonadota bacterium]
MTFETIEFAIEDAIATITLNRPDEANALNARMADELFEASVRCSTDPAVRAVVLTAKGKLFCGGGDLNEMDAAGDGREAHLLRMATILHQAVIRFSLMDAPLVIGVNGTAGGGGFSLVLAGDYVVTSAKAKFVSAYTSSGLTPDGSSTYHIAKHVGLLRAKELVLTNRVLGAEEARDWGLVSKVVAPEEVAAEAQAMAAKFAAGPTKAFGGSKRLLATAYSASMHEQLDHESLGIAGMMKTHDGPHGLQAFLMKQPPAFKGE